MKKMRTLNELIDTHDLVFPIFQALILAGTIVGEQQTHIGKLYFQYRYE